MNTLVLEVHYKWTPHKGTVKRRVSRLLRQMYPALIMNSPPNGTIGCGFSMGLDLYPDKIRAVIDLDPLWAGKRTENLVRSLKTIKNVSSVLLTEKPTSDTMPPCESHPNTAPSVPQLATSLTS